MYYELFQSGYNLKGNVLIFIMGVVWFVGCSQQESTSPSFWDKTEQSASNRILKGSLTVSDSINLEERFGLMNSHRLLQNRDFFFITDYSSSDYAQIYIINKSDLELHQIVNVFYGRGPGEVERQDMRDLAVNDESLLLSSTNLQKIVIFDFDGNLLQESITDFFMMGRNQFRSDGLMVLFSNPLNFSGDPLFFLVNNYGQRVATFGDISERDFNHLKVYGYNAIDEHNNFYYAGYAEPIIKKWNSDGELVFSVGTVGNPESDFNYISSVQGDELRVMGYAHGAYYSTNHIFICGDYICLEHLGDVDFESSRYLDVYDKEDGKYQFSYTRPTNRVIWLVVSEGHFYGLEYINDELHLMQYQISD